MYKITIVAALVVGSMALAQGKSGRSKEAGPDDQSNKMKGSSISIGDQKGKQDKGGLQSQGAPKLKGGQGKIVVSNGKTHQNDGHKPNKPDHKHQVKGEKGKGPHHKQGHGNHGTKVDHDKYKKGHPNFGYLYVNTPGIYSYKNYGQWRSEQAKNKHKKYRPENEKQAVEGIKLIVLRNTFLFTEIRNKINLIKSRLLDRRKSGEITEAQFEKTFAQVDALEKRRAAVDVKIVL